MKHICGLLLLDALQCILKLLLNSPMLQIKGLKIANYISPNVGQLPVFSEEDILEMVYKSLQNSAIPALIQNKDNEFVGLISLRKILYLHRSRFSTKSGNVMFTPPFLTVEDTLEKGIQQMLALGLFILPVFDPESENIKKIVGFLNLYELIGEFKDFQLAEVLQKPYLLDVNSTVKEGYEILRNNKSTRLILVNSAGGLEGMVTQRSLADGLLTSVGRQKFSTRDGIQENYSFDSEQIFRIDAPIKNFMISPEVIERAPVILEEIFELYSEKRINSLLIVDAEGKPLFVITLRSLLQHILLMQDQEKLAVAINGIDDLGSFQKGFQNSADDFFSDYKTQMDLRSLSISIKTASTDESKIIEYEIVSETLSGDGRVIVGKDKNIDAITALRNTFDKIETQHRRQKSQSSSDVEIDIE